MYICLKSVFVVNVKGLVAKLPLVTQGVWFFKVVTNETDLFKVSMALYPLKEGPGTFSVIQLSQISCFYVQDLSCPYSCLACPGRDL